MLNIEKKLIDIGFYRRSTACDHDAYSDKARIVYEGEVDVGEKEKMYAHVVLSRVFVKKEGKPVDSWIIVPSESFDHFFMTDRDNDDSYYRFHRRIDALEKIAIVLRRMDNPWRTCDGQA